MRLYSIHPQYLDQKGLCGLWRESLLAQSVLLKGEFLNCEGKQKIKTPYYNHPQLDRFRQLIDRNMFLSVYLHYIYDEGIRRGYKFDIKKIDRYDFAQSLKGAEHLLLLVTKGQLQFEFEHLQNKLFNRDMKKFQENRYTHPIISNPLFKVIDGQIESWERN